jgi:ABC-type branched-subunit amino acid transport system substrate-binding protein
MMKTISNLLKTTRNLWLPEPAVDTTYQQRRQFLTCSAHIALATPMVLSALVWTPQPAQAQARRPVAAASSITVAQIVDVSQSQQDISKDFLVGSRAAWQDINTRGGIQGRSVTHLAIEVDGSAQSLRTAWDQVQNDPSCIVMSGCAADPLATYINAMLRNSKSGLANVAPWQQNSSVETAPHTFTIFSNREEQLTYALRSLSNLNVNSLAVVFASQEERLQNLPDIQRIAQKLSLGLQDLVLLSDLLKTGQTLNPNSAAIVLFVGGTPELAQFTQSLEKQSRQRYVIALADVNLQTLQQMGKTRNIPVIATQAVPLISSALPVVRSYRQVLTRLYDEPPVSLSLAGFIAASYTCEVMKTIDGPLTRSSVLEAFTRRQSMDIGGFRVAFEAQRRTSVYVTQSMLGAGGRVIG